MAHSSQAARGFAAADGTLSQRIGIAKLHHDDCQRQPAEVFDADRWVQWRIDLRCRCLLVGEAGRVRQP
jgi:hypothetical protein